MNKLYLAARGIVWALLKVLFPWKLSGLENLPKDGAVMLCGNHTSFLDPLLVMCCVPRQRQLHIVAKAELFQIPVLGFLLRKADMIPVKRGKSDIAAFKESLRVFRKQGMLLIFPEGTRVKPGQEIEAHTGAVVIAARADVPVMPVYIGAKKRLFRKTEIVFGEPYALEFVGKKPAPEESQQLTAELMKRIRALGEIQ